MDKEEREELLHEMIEFGFNKGFINSVADDYAEPGYTKDGEGPILFADWNDNPPKEGERWPSTFYRYIYPKPEFGNTDHTKFFSWLIDAYKTLIDEDYDPDDHYPYPITFKMYQEILKDLGCTLEWSDEWITCSNCGNAVRYSGDCYGWLPYFTDIDGEVTCGNCLKKDPEDYLDYLKDNERAANVFDFIDLYDHGYAPVNEEHEEFASGFHPGQNDSPAKILKTLNKAGIWEVIFEITNTGQFDTHFIAWVKKEDLSKARYALLHGDTKDYPSPVKSGNIQTREIDPERFVEHGILTDEEIREREERIQKEREKNREKM